MIGAGAVVGLVPAAAAIDAVEAGTGLGGLQGDGGVGARQARTGGGGVAAVAPRLGHPHPGLVGVDAALPRLVQAQVVQLGVRAQIDLGDGVVPVGAQALVVFHQCQAGALPQDHQVAPLGREALVAHQVDEGQGGLHGRAGGHFDHRPLFGQGQVEGAQAGIGAVQVGDEAVDAGEGLSVFRQGLHEGPHAHPLGELVQARQAGVEDPVQEHRARPVDAVDTHLGVHRRRHLAAGQAQLGLGEGVGVGVLPFVQARAGEADALEGLPGAPAQGVQPGEAGLARGARQGQGGCLQRTWGAHGAPAPWASIPASSRSQP